ncbi:hypothetical protein [uncultured Psychromonas sp.]|uniref:hypothetical protein n=1 Tax=uncultured Psychromonas sp. TaxID=173974 RepID=UPI002603B8F0|nr:hypothetical protein [uncultured Psychromonas sp.]
MKLIHLIKDVTVPLISVGTAMMVGFLNYQVSLNDKELRERDQQLEERIGEIDLLVKTSKEEREERESNQNFNIRIYDIVIKSLEDKDLKKQEAAQAFVVVMVEEPLRTSLLSVLKQGGEDAIKVNIGRILEEEEKFQNKVSITPKENAKVTPSYNWGEWDLDIFWCSTSKEVAKHQAEVIGAQLLAEGAKGRIRIRELPDSINAKSGYQIEGYAIRRNTNEQNTAAALKRLAEKSLRLNGVKVEFNLGLTRQNTPWYISTFVCPSN